MTYQPAGNYYDKYYTRNPIARALMNGFLRSFDELVLRSNVNTTAFEVGCGEGELSIRLARRGLAVQAADIAPDAIDEARERALRASVQIPFQVASIHDLNPEKHSADLIVCCEVMEHLDRPDLAIEKLASLCRKRMIASVPREPVWRVLNIARGKYIKDLGNTPGHVQHWSSKDFTGLLSRRFKVIEVRKPLPWTMVLCEPLR